MNEKIKQLAETAGFIPWGDESWNPGDVIDWSSRYDDELVKFYNLVLEDIIARVKVLEKDSRNHISYMLKNEYFSTP